MNLGNILGQRASVAQSSRFRQQMQGSAVAAALVSPTSQRRQQPQQQRAPVARLPLAPANDPIILTHRGGQRSGGTVWQNDEYWQRRKAEKRAQRQRQPAAQASYAYYDQQQQQQYAAQSGMDYRRPGTYPKENLRSARNSVPRLALDSGGHSGGGRDYRAPPLKRRGGDDAALGPVSYTHLTLPTIYSV